MAHSTEPRSGIRRLLDPHAFLIAVIIFVLIVLVSRIYLNLHFLDPLGHSLKDYEVTDIYYSQIRDRQIELEERIVLVNIGWPDRARIAAMLDRILDAGPRVLGVDIFLSGQKDSLVDARLQATMKRGGDRIVLATELRDYNDSLDIFQSVAVDDTMFSNYTQVGFANFPGNPTRTVRYFSPSEPGPQGQVMAFAVQLARHFDPEAVEDLMARGKPIERIHYTATEDHFIRLEPQNVLDTTYDLGRVVKDKIVIVGYSGTDDWNDPVLDRYYTPLNIRYSGKGKPDMFGMVIHANIVTMILDSTYVRQVPDWVNVILAFLLCYFSLLIFIWISHHYHGVYHPVARVIQIVLFALIFLIIMYLYEHYRLKWDFSLGLIALALSVDTQLVYFSVLQFIRRRRQKIHKGQPAGR